jgi:prevent-host-death family protein
MKKASITEAKNNLSALIDGLKSGSPVLIMDRGRPVARLEPIRPGDESDDARTERLVRQGIMRRGKGGPLPPDFFENMPKLKDGISVVEALLAERREGR